jgi:hypothetical protein
MFLNFWECENHDLDLQVLTAIYQNFNYQNLKQHTQ